MQSSRAYDDHHAVYHVHHPDNSFVDQDSSDADSSLEKPSPIEEHEREEVEEPEKAPSNDDKDVEAGDPRLEKLQSRRSARSLKDPNLVTWDGPDDPKNPKNWSYGRKWAATFVVSSFTFISPVSSSMLAPAIQALSKDIGISSEIEAELTLSIFVLAYAIGPLFLGPLSEVYGRVHVLQMANAFFFAWTLGCAFAQNVPEMIVFRLMSGLGGSAPLSIGGGVLSDTWSPDERGKAISIYSLAPLLGPAVGPIAGAWIAEKTTWRWVFWSIAIVDVAIFVSGIFFLQETYGPTLLARKAARLRKETGNQALHTEWEHPDRTLGKIIKTALIRPFRLLFTQPIIQFIAVYMAYLYGIMYLIFYTFPGVWTNQYGESVGIGGLNYISLGIGFSAGKLLPVTNLLLFGSTNKRFPQVRKLPPRSTIASTDASRRRTVELDGRSFVFRSCSSALCSSLLGCSGTDGLPRQRSIGSCQTLEPPFSLPARLSASSACRHTLLTATRSMQPRESQPRWFCEASQDLVSRSSRRTCTQPSSTAGETAFWASLPSSLASRHLSCSGFMAKRCEPRANMLQAEAGEVPLPRALPQFAQLCRP